MELAKYAAARFVRVISSSGVKCGWEIFTASGRGNSVEWAQGELEGMKASSSSGVGLRLLRDGCAGFAHTGDTSSVAIDFAAESAVKMLGMGWPQPHARFTAPGGAAFNASLEYTDAGLDAIPVADHIDRLRAMEARALSDRRITKVLRVAYGDSYGETALVNSLGLEVSTRGTSASCSMLCVAGSDGETQISGEAQTRRFFRDLDFDWITSGAVRRSAGLLGARRIATCRAPVVLDPPVACEFLEMAAGDMAADEVQKRQTPFVGKMGAMVGSGEVTIIDDGTLVKGAATGPFDDEGTPTQKTVLMEKGVVRAWLYDNATASKDRTRSTGSASRGSYSGIPSPGTSNLYLAPGTTGREELLRRAANGLYVQEVMGMHNADPVSGDFSVGVAGYWIKDGRLAHAVRGLTLAGNLLDLLAGVECAGSDLVWYGATGSPTVLLAPMQIGGD